MSVTEHAGRVRIHIDREPHDSLNPTTGAALYALGGVSEHHDLFREIGGDHEDELIERHAHDVHLEQDQHFYSQKVITIVMNGVQKEVAKKRLSYLDAIKLAFPEGPFGGNIRYTVEYTKPDGTEGSLVQGQHVDLVEGMSFDVDNTDKS